MSQQQSPSRRNLQQWTLPESKGAALSWQPLVHWLVPKAILRATATKLPFGHSLNAGMGSALEKSRFLCTKQLLLCTGDTRNAEKAVKTSLVSV
jgi:hypothetical protein